MTQVIQPLRDRALLVRLTRKTYNPYTKDDSVLHTANAVGVGNFNKHLFKDKNSRVARTNQAFSEVYEYHRDHTSPWVDNGPRMIRTDKVPEYKQAMRNLIAAAEAAVNDLIENWDAEVQADLDRITAMNPTLAKRDDYPDASSIRERYAAEITFMPLPDGDDFRIGMEAEDIKRLEDAVIDAEKKSTEYVLAQLMEPLRAAADKLKVDIGEKGSIFRDSLTANIVEVAERMESVNLSQDPEIAKAIKFVKDLGSYSDDRKDDLRNNPNTRKNAAKKIDETVDKLAAKMEGLV